MDGFSKFNLDEKAPQTPSNPVSMAAKKPILRLPHLNSRTSIILAGVLVVVVLFGIFGVYLPATRVYSQAKKTYTAAKMALTALKQQNISAASDGLDATRPELLQTQKDLQSMGYLALIPVANWYYNDASHLLQAGVYGLNAGQILVDSIKPYADVLGLKGQGSFVGGSAQERIQTAVTTMSKVTPKIDEIGVQLALMQKEVDEVDPNHYPALLGGKKVNDQLKALKLGVDEAATFVTQAKPLIKVLPSLLGEPTEQKYLVIFQNDKELRPTGGFMTQYAIFSVAHGLIRVDNSSDIYNLDNTIATHPVAPRPILEYLPKVNTLNLRDTNLSPDFVVSMQDFNKLYKQAGGYVPVSGIIAVDTHALVAAMNVLGDITVDGTTFSTQIQPQCKCPQVIYALEQQVDTPVNYVKTNRKAVVTDLMYAIMQKAFASSPKLYWGPLFQTMINEVSQKHVLFNIYNADAQAGLEALDAGGRIKSVDGDYLHVNDSNMGGAKSNLFIAENVEQNYQIQSDGSIVKTVTIHYKNPFPPSDCNLERGGLCLNAVQRDWLRVYVPQGSKLVSSSGSQVKVSTYNELGKTVFEGFLTVNPLGAATYSLTYQLPFKIDGSVLPVVIQKQPGTDGQEYTIKVNNNTIDDFVLQTDTTKNLKLR